MKMPMLDGADLGIFLQKKNDEVSLNNIILVL